MTYAEFETNLLNALQQLYDAGETYSIADWILEEITGNNRYRRRQIPNEEIVPDIQSKLEDAKNQLLQHKPVQYIFGHAHFYSLNFLVNESVLIPRPETEELIEWVINSYKKSIKPLQILDVGTGSGCIPITIKKKLPFAIVSSVDISNEALLLAKENAILNDTKVQFIELDFLDEKAWIQLGKYDIIVSNPPYIPNQEKAKLDKNVTDWEPGLALFVPDTDPLVFYKKIAAFGREHLQKDGAIFMETHHYFASAVQNLFRQNDYTATIKKDINGNERMVKAVYN